MHPEILRELTSMRGREMRTRQMRQRRRGQVAIDDIDIRCGLAQAFHDRRGNLAADGVGAQHAGVDMQKFHGITLVV